MPQKSVLKIFVIVLPKEILAAGPHQFFFWYDIEYKFVITNMQSSLIIVLNQSFFRYENQKRSQYTVHVNMFLKHLTQSIISASQDREANLNDCLGTVQQVQRL